MDRDEYLALLDDTESKIKAIKKKYRKQSKFVIAFFIYGIVAGVVWLKFSFIEIEDLIRSIGFYDEDCVFALAAILYWIYPLSIFKVCSYAIKRRMYRSPLNKIIIEVSRAACCLAMFSIFGSRLGFDHSVIVKSLILTVYPLFYLTEDQRHNRESRDLKKMGYEIYQSLNIVNPLPSEFDDRLNKAITYKLQRDL